MSNRIFQSVLHQMKDVVERTVGVIDEGGVVVACSDLGRIGENYPIPITNFAGINGPFSRNRTTYRAFGSSQKPEYLLFIDGDDQGAEKFAEILAIALSNIEACYEEKYDKTNFIKNVILDNILSGDVYLKSRELHFNTDVSRTVLVVRTTARTDVAVYDVLSQLFPDKDKDYIINLNDTDIALVKETYSDTDSADLENLGRSIVDTLSGEFYTHAVVGIGTTVDTIKDLSRSFKEAQVALEVGKVFDIEKSIVSYNNLGIARLIYQLPATLCESFLKEVFKSGTIESLDQETLFTIQKFFENNLNVSETSRKLFVHRNTLVYRLEKIKRITGLDLREFDHAIVFKIALMVNKYLKSSGNK